MIVPPTTSVSLAPAGHHPHPDRPALGRETDRPTDALEDLQPGVALDLALHGGREGDAVLFPRASGQPERWLRIVPHESGWEFGALWFSFIPVRARHGA